VIYPDPVFDTELNSMERSYQSKTDNYLTINVSLTSTRLVSEMGKTVTQLLLVLKNSLFLTFCEASTISTGPTHCLTFMA